MEHDILVLKKEIINYIGIIKQEYSSMINLTDLNIENCVSLENTGTVSLFVSNGVIHLPILAYDILKNNKNNKSSELYDNSNLIENDNGFDTYLNHLINDEISTLRYFEEIILHEVFHMLGSGGSTALREGINEYLTRLLALKYSIITNGCAYPKELKIVLKLEKIYGLPIMKRISFAKTNEEIIEILSPFDNEKINLFFEVQKMMETEFYSKYYKYKFPDPFIKVEKYNSIDYSAVNEFIDNYIDKKKVSIF